MNYGELKNYGKNAKTLSLLIYSQKVATFNLEEKIFLSNLLEQNLFQNIKDILSYKKTLTL